ncbi:MORN repeat-containing protein [Aureibaculum conchae]|uniref:hypothetical protein n=1 Tax=Aureibaculum sp. 2308TA14-22 TaxID=3108392 RepID=UPI0033945BD3
MKIKLTILFLFLIFTSCDSVVFKESLPTYGGKNLTEFPKELRGVYVDSKTRLDSLYVTKDQFLYVYKKDSTNYKRTSGQLNKDTYAKNYKFNLFISIKPKGVNFYSVRNVLLRNGNLHFYRANAYKKSKMVLKDLIFDYSYNDAQMAHVLKPTNKELDQLLAKNVFVLDKIFVPLNNPYKKSITVSKKGCISGNCTNGYGYYRYDNSYYKGFFKNGNRHGYGYYSWNDGQFYFGDWKNNERSGYGEHFFSKTSFYIGKWAKNKFNGYGYKKDKNGNYSRGIWQLGVLAFKFKFDFNKTNKGCTYGDCKDGYGRIIFDNGHYYTGFFRNGKPFLGEYNFTGGQLYRGELTANYKFSGSGYFLWKNKSYYRGKFENGQKQGLGFYRNGENHSELKGVWASDKLVKSY